MVDICERDGYERQELCCTCLEKKCIYQSTQSHNNILFTYVKNHKLCQCTDCTRNVQQNTYDRYWQRSKPKDQ